MVFCHVLLTLTLTIITAHDLTSCIQIKLLILLVLFTRIEAAIFIRNRKLGVVEFVRVSELHLPLPSYVEWKTRLGKSPITSFRAQWNTALASRMWLHVGT